MATDWSKIGKTLWGAFQTNGYCWIGAVIGLASIGLFSWVHTYNIPNDFWWILERPDAAVPGPALGTPGALLFLAGTLLAFVTYVGGIVQVAGLVWFFSFLSERQHTFMSWHLEPGFYMAGLSAFFVLLGWGLPVKRRVVRMNVSRIAALSPRLGLFAR